MSPTSLLLFLAALFLHVHSKDPCTFVNDDYCFHFGQMSCYLKICECEVKNCTDIRNCTISPWCDPSGKNIKVNETFHEIDQDCGSLRKNCLAGSKGNGYCYLHKEKCGKDKEVEKRLGNQSGKGSAKDCSNWKRKCATKYRKHHACKEYKRNCGPLDFPIGTNSSRGSEEKSDEEEDNRTKSRLPELASTVAPTTHDRSQSGEKPTSLATESPLPEVTSAVIPTRHGGIHSEEKPTPSATKNRLNDLTGTVVPTASGGGTHSGEKPTPLALKSPLPKVTTAVIPTHRGGTHSGEEPTLLATKNRLPELRSTVARITHGEPHSEEALFSLFTKISPKRARDCEKWQNKCAEKYPKHFACTQFKKKCRLFGNQTSDGDVSPAKNSTGSEESGESEVSSKLARNCDKWESKCSEKYPKHHACRQFKKKCGSMRHRTSDADSVLKKNSTISGGSDEEEEKLEILEQCQKWKKTCASKYPEHFTCRQFRRKCGHSDDEAATKPRRSARLSVKTSATELLDKSSTNKTSMGTDRSTSNETSAILDTDSD